MIRSHPILLAIFLLTPIAQADPWREGTALITCYPGAGYFELSSRQSYPDGIAPERGVPDVPDTHSPSELEARPYSCELPAHLITVEGRDLVDGKGYCGARAGAQVRVLVDGKPVAYNFGSEVKSKPSSSALLRDGWIELSDCFERSHSVTVSSTGSSVSVELCRVAAGDAEPDTSFVPLRGACKIWSRSDPTFQHQD